MTKYFFLLVFIACCSCANDDGPGYQKPYNPYGNIPEVEKITDEEVMDLTQKETFKYFWDYAEVNSGAARERFHPSDPSLNQNVVTSGGTGFGIMSILVGIERNFITRVEGEARLHKIVSFLENANRFHGAWSHWLNGESGNVIPFSEKDDGGDIVETAFLVQGLICLREYFKNGSETEKELAEKADTLWKGVEWTWYTQGQDVIYWHWSPNYNFDISLKLSGYNETLIAYILAASSPDYPIGNEVYNNGWASSGEIISTNTQYSLPLVLKHAGAPNYGGPLFFAHYSYLGLNPTTLTDQYANYWDLNTNHSKINYQYCISNPLNYIDYGPECWGLTASYTRNSDGTLGYKAHKPSNDSGVISPTAAISSIPYTPTESLKAIHFFYSKKDKLLGPAGFYDAFSPQHNYWVAEAYLAIDQGPQIIMIENYRSGLLWSLFMQNEDVIKGLNKLGFNY